MFPLNMRSFLFLGDFTTYKLVMDITYIKYFNFFLISNYKNKI